MENQVRDSSSELELITAIQLLLIWAGRDATGLLKGQIRTLDPLIFRPDYGELSYKEETQPVESRQGVHGGCSASHTVPLCTERCGEGKLHSQQLS